MRCSVVLTNRFFRAASLGVVVTVAGCSSSDSGAGATDAATSTGPGLSDAAIADLKAKVKRALTGRRRIVAFDHDCPGIARNDHVLAHRHDVEAVLADV